MLASNCAEHKDAGPMADVAGSAVRPSQASLLEDGPRSTQTESVNSSLSGTFKRRKGALRRE
jgi:hypothetical protein